MKSEKRTIVLPRSTGLTVTEARETIARLKKVGLIPPSLEIQLVRIPGAPVETRQFSSAGSTAGARFLVREAREPAPATRGR